MLRILASSLILTFAVFLSSKSNAMYCETLTWEPPTEREDGTPFLVSEIQHYELYIGTKSQASAPEGDKTYEHTVSVPADKTSHDCSKFNIPEGKYFISGKVIDNGGLESKFSSEITRDILSDKPKSKPMPPTFMVKPKW